MPFSFAMVKHLQREDARRIDAYDIKWQSWGLRKKHLCGRRMFLCTRLPGPPICLLAARSSQPGFITTLILDAFSLVLDPFRLIARIIQRIEPGITLIPDTISLIVETISLIVETISLIHETFSLIAASIQRIGPGIWLMYRCSRPHRP